MRVVSLVPSWTETFLRAGVNVVGRTRFCIHPVNQVQRIPILGGTKDLKAEELNALAPDLVILDREENPKEFTSRINAPILDTHVDSLPALESELRRLAIALGNDRLAAEADRARRLSEKPPRAPAKLPGLIEELSPWSPSDEVVYVIWKNPWMAAAGGTYIADVLKRLGIRCKTLPPGKYPTIAEADFENAYALFSSEPFPFAKKSADLKSARLKGAVVDGEGFSWFGSRSLDFLESHL